MPDIDSDEADGLVPGNTGGLVPSSSGGLVPSSTGGLVPSSTAGTVSASNVPDVRKRICSKGSGPGGRVPVLPPKEEILDADGGDVPAPTTPVTKRREPSPNAGTGDDAAEAPKPAATDDGDASKAPMPAADDACKEAANAPKPTAAKADEHAAEAAKPIEGATVSEKADENPSGIVPGDLGTVLDAQTDTVAISGGHVPLADDTLPAAVSPGKQQKQMAPTVAIEIPEGRPEANMSECSGLNLAHMENPKGFPEANMSESGGLVPAYKGNPQGRPEDPGSVSGGLVPTHLKADLEEDTSEFGGSVPEEGSRKRLEHVAFNSLADDEDVERDPGDDADPETKLRYALRYPEQTGANYLTQRFSVAERAVLYRNMARATGEYTTGKRADRVKKLWAWIRDSHTKGTVSQCSEKSSSTKMFSSRMTAHEVMNRFGADGPKLISSMEKRPHPINPEVTQYRYLEDTSKSSTAKKESMALSSSMSVAAEDAVMVRGCMASQNLQLTMPQSQLLPAASSKPPKASTKAAAKSKQKEPKPAPKAKASGKRKRPQKSVEEMMQEAQMHKEKADAAYAKAADGLSSAMQQAIEEKLEAIEGIVSAGDAITEEELEECRLARVSVCRMVKL